MPTTNTDPAHRVFRADGTEADLGAWRAAWRSLLRAANVITVFSENSRGLVAQAYPEYEAKLNVTPHTLLEELPATKPGQSKDGKPVIGILGNIGYPKGADIVRGLSEKLAQQGGARLVVIGNVDPAYLPPKSTIVHGDYRVSDIPALIARYGISQWFIPSIWPETFSYTTHETLATGLPVWSFDLGAQGDRVAAAAFERGQGGTISLELASADPNAILDVMLKDQGKRNVA